MIRRVMAAMGLLAFGITVLGGLASQNSFEHTISRALWAMAGFCLLGMVVGWAAERVVREYRSKQYEDVFGHPQGTPTTEESDPEISSTPSPTQPIQN